MRFQSSIYSVAQPICCEFSGTHHEKDGGPKCPAGHQGGDVPDLQAVCVCVCVQLAILGGAYQTAGKQGGCVDGVSECACVCPACHPGGYIPELRQACNGGTCGHAVWLAGHIPLPILLPPPSCVTHGPPCCATHGPPPCTWMDRP